LTLAWRPETQQLWRGYKMSDMTWRYKPCRGLVSWAAHTSPSDEESAAARAPRHCLLCVLHSNVETYQQQHTHTSTPVLHHFWDIWRWISSRPWNLGYRSLKFIETSTIRKLRYCFLFAFHCNYGSILYNFRDNVEYCSKITIFSYPLHSTSPLGRSPLQYCHTVWYQYGKTRMAWLPNSENSLMIRSSSSSRVRFMNHNWSAKKQHLHLQSVAEISRHSVLSEDRIRQCETSSGSRHKDTDQCL